MFDMNVMTKNLFQRLIDGVENLRSELPETEEIDYYIRSWVKVFTEGRDLDVMTAEQKVDALKSASDQTAYQLAQCIARGCQQADQHLFMAKVVLLVHKEVEVASKEILDDLLGQDDFFKAIFGSGFN